ncbi:SGNH/GDSL hydrolase family protein [Staphylococcus lentus]|uniref:SGNH/GDSL hydrolase family protein n=1 Tax=Mammaliicoccus lentus TaxID=42858 RepID=UPI0018831EFF|nr:SGNH/GDSL hydrolase family protein [Mammaliicoccus lentus]MBF0842302.1 SGNH/GDSL hydrolase family protein [Mammaliicoccus lentus]
MQTRLPTTIGKGLKDILESNFEEIELFMQGFNNENLEENIKRIYEKHYEQLQKEIRAIVTPEMSPLEVTEEFEKSKIDLRGNKCDSLSERLQNDFKLLNNEHMDANILATENGTIMYDFTSKSKIRQIKKIACIGDSVARGSWAKKNYGQMLAEKLGASLSNTSVSASTMSTLNPNSIYDQATKVRNAELIILQGTDDDWISNGGIPIGKDKTDVKTFYGAFYQAVQALKAYNKGAEIVVMTATRQLPVKNGVIRRKDTDRNKLGLTLEDYVDAQVLACSELNVPVFDAYHTNLIDPYNPAFRAKNMVDGLHPNELGHEVIMYELIKNYYYFYG